jgi:hypothetical protein
MEIALSTQMAQDALATQLDAVMTRKGLDAQRQDGANALQLIEAAAPTLQDPALGRSVNVRV